MSDSRDDVNEAVRKNRYLLARLQVREEAISDEVKALTAERATATGELAEALGQKIAELESERASIASDRKDVMSELAALDKLGGRLPAMEAQALAREALALAGVDPDAAPPPTGRMTDDEARAQLAALKAARAGAPSDAPKGETPPTPPKRTL